MLRKQHKVDDSHNDMPLIYYVEGHSLHFDRPEFALITGLTVTILDVIGVIEDDKKFGNLDDEDSIRLCLILALDVIFMGRLLTCPESGITTDIKPTLAEYDSSWWICSQVYFREHVPKSLVVQHHSLFETYLSKLEKSQKRAHASCRVSSSFCTTDITTNKKWLKDEVISDLNVRVFKLETIIQVLARERNKEYGVLHFNEEFSSLGRDFIDSLNILFHDLNKPHDSDEDISNEKNIIEEQRFRMEEANRMRLEEDKMLQIAVVKKQNRHEFMNSTHVTTILAKLTPSKGNHVDYVTRKTNPKVSWVKINKCRQSLNDPSLAELLKKVKPWVEDVSRFFRSLDTVWLTPNIEQFISQPGQLKCKFPWSEDYTVVRHFWLALACLDPSRKGWLSEEHIDLWVDYMWHGRPENANWAMVSCYFVQILLQNSTPLFYTSGDKYATPWSDVDQLARLAISANSVLVKDMMVKLFEVDNERDFRIVRETYAMCLELNVRCEERREQMIKMQSFLHVSTLLAESYNLLKELQNYELEKCRELMKSISETQLKERLPVILEGAKVFDKKGINQSDYCIRFKLADSVPKQGGIFGDCGVWVCIFLYRLSHGLSLDVEDPVNVALAYREKMYIRYIKGCCQAKAFAKLIREKADNARACLAKLVVMIRELEAIDVSLMGFDILDCLKQSKELENITLKALSDLIAHAEEAIHLKEGHVDFMDLEIDH
ncbi:phospholipase-like protein [Tanacetum coccineum]